MVAGEMVESDICPAEDAVQAFLEYLVEPMLPAKSFRQGTPSQSLQKSVAKQLHAIVLLYNYYLRKRHPQLEVLGFEAFCKLVVILKPALLAHMKLMQRSDDTELDDLEKQLSVTERTIMEACDISTKLDSSKDVPNIEGWPISKVSVLLFDYKKENCFLLLSSITQGVWSVIEKDVDISNLNSEGQVEAKQMNRKRRVIRKPSKEESSVNESALLQLAYLAVKEATGINQTDLVVSESHVVCSLSKEKTAVRFYIMYCNQSVNEAGFQVPIKDALESLQAPLVRKSSSRWMVTPVVEYFHMLPYAGIVSTWLSGEVPSGFQDARVGGGSSNLNGPDWTENDLRVGEGNSSLNSPDRTEKLGTPEIHKSGNSPHIDDGLVGIFCNQTKSNDTESLEEKNKNNGEKYKKIADTIQVDNHQEKMSNFRESDLNVSTSNIKIKDEMEESMVRPGITECGGKQNADGNRTYDNMLTAQDVIDDHDLATCQPNSINLYKLQNTIASKQSDLSPSALRVLLSKRDELSLQQRKIEDEIAQCDKKIQKILNGGEDDLALKIESLIEGCNGVCLRSIPEERTYQQLEDQCSPQNLKRRRLSETVLSMQNPCQHHMDDANETFRDQNLWNDGMEDILIEMLYQETLMDTLKGGKITNQDHIWLAERLSAIGPKNFNSEQVKGKINCLKRRQHEFTDLMNQSGMGWDPERKAPVGSEEHWANALKVRPTFKQFKTSGCPKYEMLCIIFACSVATGTLHRTLIDLAPNSDDEWRLQQESRSHGRPVIDLEGGPSGSAYMDVSMQSGRPLSTSYKPGSSPKQRGGPSEPVALPEEFSQCLEEIKYIAAARAKACEDGRYGEMSAKHNEGSNSTESDGTNDIQVHCMKLLEAITPSLSPVQFNKAFDRLLDPSVQRSFMAISDIRRSEWVWNLP